MVRRTAATLQAVRSFILVVLGLLVGLVAGLLATSGDKPSPRPNGVDPRLEVRLAALERAMDRLGARLQPPSPGTAAPASGGSDTASTGSETAPRRPGEDLPEPDSRRPTVRPTDEARLRVLGDEMTHAFATKTYAKWRARLDERYLFRTLGQVFREFGRPSRVIDDMLVYELPGAAGEETRDIGFVIRNSVVMQISVTAGR